ncbi:MAG TPA: aspartate aminotransferase family protein [Desulfobacteria bacterium]|nr:aspartate aminotransferase family protein [Desulfobacteria bacterium]
MSNAESVSMGQKYVMNTYGRLPMALVKGKGARVWDADGNEYLDFVAGLAVNSLGHCHPKVVEAIREQAGTLLHCSNLYWIEPQIQLAKLLVENSFADKVFFCNSGAEANESALKLAKKYAKKNYGPDKYEVITLKKSFHGRTLATLTATGQQKYHQGYEPLPEGFKYATINDIDELKAQIGPKTCAVMLEPVQGEGGVHVVDFAYLQQVKELCQQYGALLIFDEVQCGLGRTGKLFAYEHSGVTPDIVSLAKALAGGTAIGAMLATDKVAAAFCPGDHASTFGGNPLATAAGIAAVTALLEEKIVENAAAMGEVLAQKLREFCRKYSFATGERGLGLIRGLQLSIDGRPIVEKCREKGLLINCVGTDVLRFIPPLIINEADINQAMQIVDEVLAETEAS